jgi:Ice-binding-like/PEP-CTERM motif
MDMIQFSSERMASKVKCKLFIPFVVTALVALLCYPAMGDTIVPVLGTAQDYAVLGHTTVTNVGSTRVFGSNSILANVGVWQAGGIDAITGFSTQPGDNKFYGPGPFSNGPGIVKAPAGIHGGDDSGPGNAFSARNDLINAYNALALLPATGDLSGQILGDTADGGTVPALGPGVYTFTSSAQLNGTLQLDAGGKDGVSWVFQIGSTLTTASASAVQLINPGGNLGADDGVFWLVGSDATLGSTTAFEGNILALDSITLITGATIYNGRALAQVGAVTLGDNVISDICLDTNGNYIGPGFSGVGFNAAGELVPVTANGGPPPTIPEPGTFLLIGSGLAGLVAFRKRSKKA